MDKFSMFLVSKYQKSVLVNNVYLVELGVYLLDWSTQEIADGLEI